LVDIAVKPTYGRLGKADGRGEETGKCTLVTAGIGVQASRERPAEITSGTTIYQQGLATTCKDRRYKGRLKAYGGIWWGAWACMSDEGWVKLAEAVWNTAPEEVTPLTGKGALGRWRALERKHQLDTEPEIGDNLNGRRAGGIIVCPRGVCMQELKPWDERKEL
jgi:hypothetical protein